MDLHDSQSSFDDGDSIEKPFMLKPEDFVEQVWLQGLPRSGKTALTSNFAQQYFEAVSRKNNLSESGD